MKKTKLQKGITLIALIITIVVLLILAVVTIGAIQESKIIMHAQNAARDYTIAQEKEKIALGHNEYKISRINNPLASLQVEGAKSVSKDANGWIVEFENGNKYLLSETGEITKDEPMVYDPNGWKYAWTSDGTTWSDIIEKSKLEEGAIVEDKIIAKIYETEEPIEAMSMDGLNIPAGKGYHLKIDVTEGTIEMPTCRNNDKGEFYGWVATFLKYTLGEVSEPVVPYITKVIIGEGITNIPDYEFQGAGYLSLKEIDIANTVTTIGESAFEESGLSSIVIPGSVKTIGEYAFRSCEKLNTVIMENGVTEIGSNAFDYCSNLTKLIIPNSVTKIGTSAFATCKNLTTVIIPESVLLIGSRAFEWCEELKKIYIESTSSNFEVQLLAFNHIAENSTIFVRNDAIVNEFNKKDGQYTRYNSSTTSISTDYNWIAPTN